MARPFGALCERLSRAAAGMSRTPPGDYGADDVIEPSTARHPLPNPAYPTASQTAGFVLQHGRPTGAERINPGKIARNSLVA